MHKYITIDELSALAKLKKSAIYGLVYEKKIPYTKIGNRLRFREDLIESWLKENTFVPFLMNAQGKSYNK